MKTILIIDTNADFSNQLAEILWMEGFKTLHAFDGVSGLHIAEEYPPDLIVSDLFSLTVGSLEFLNRLRETPGLCHIPVIVLSVMTGHRYEAEALAGGAALYLLKPFEVAELLAGVHNVLPG